MIMIIATNEGGGKMFDKDGMTIEEHFYWITAVLGLLALAIFMTLSNPTVHI
jgi:hypothetical protein